MFNRWQQMLYNFISITKCKIKTKISKTFHLFLIYFHKMNECLSDSEVEKLLDSMTKSGAQELNSNQMKQLKTYCRKSDDNIDRVFRQLFDELNRNDSQIRVTALRIISELFCRSHRLKQMTIDSIQKWNKEFGEG